MSTSTSTESPDAVRCEALCRENAVLRRQLEDLKALADEVVAAETWDHEVYGRIPGPGWLLIDRESWARVMAAFDRVDSWRPWER